MKKTILFAMALAVLSGAGLAAQAPAAGGSARVRGRVMAAEQGTPGAPVPGIPAPQAVARGNRAQLAGRSDTGQAVSITAPIDVEGVFEFRDVPRGEYQVSVLPGISISPVRIVVGAGDVQVRLGGALGRVSGTVNVEGGGPVPSFQLEFVPVPSGGSSDAPSSSIRPRATFSVDIPSGAYRIAATGLPSGLTVRSITTGAADLTRESLTVGLAEPARIAVTLGIAGAGPWTTVSGRLVSVTGAPVPPDRTLSLAGAALSEPITATVGSDGAFTFSKAIPGTYDLRIMPGGVPTGKPLVVGPSGLRNVTITLPDPATLVGEFVRIEPGEFMMGCSPGDARCDPNERPAHRVGITKGFEIGKFEVTQTQWEAVMGNNPSAFKAPSLPVENINTFAEVQEFIARLNAMGGAHRYRLPTEAEWEYAARAGSNEAYPGGLDATAWHGQNSQRRTMPVGLKQPNAWGLYDMLGNVWEWVEDWYSPAYYADSPALDPPGPSSGPLHVLRGGSAFVPMEFARVSYRGNRPYGGSDYVYGLRLVREAISK